MVLLKDPNDQDGGPKIKELSLDPSRNTDETIPPTRDGVPNGTLSTEVGGGKGIIKSTCGPLQHSKCSSTLEGNKDTESPQDIEYDRGSVVNR